MEVTVDFVNVEGDNRTVPGVRGTCMGCSHKEECFGQTERSVKRLMVVMRENCPEGGEHYYVEED